MKYLGIDYGTKRIGLAISDDNGEMAFPYVVIPNRGIMHAADDIIMACKNKNIEAIVIGESLNYALEDNPIMKHVKKLEQHLKEKINLPVFYEDETLSSAEAERIQGKGRLHDASAAAVILNSYLAKLKNQNVVGSQ